MQHRTEDLALQFADMADLDNGRRHESAVAAFAIEFELVHATAGGAHGVDVAHDAIAGLGVDHRPHVDRQAIGIAHAEFAHGAAQHRQHVVGAVFLDAQHAQLRQRWPAESKAELSTSNTTCSASADESTTIAFWPPVSAISGMVWPSSSGDRPARGR